jgi:hypothetical protein
MKNRRAIRQFLAFQIGVTTFRWSQIKKKYIGRPFNFLVCPRSVLSERNYNLNSDTIAFLDKYQFDFNAVFRNGISFTQLAKRKQIE